MEPNYEVGCTWFIRFSKGAIQTHIMTYTSLKDNRLIDTPQSIHNLTVEQQEIKGILMHVQDLCLPGFLCVVSTGVSVVRAMMDPVEYASFA